MLLLLLSLTSLPAAEQLQRPERQARASVRIQSPARATRETWNETPLERRKTITLREGDGRVTQVRVIEFE